MMDISNLQGKRTLVTGAGQGIGHAISLALGQAGASVAVADIDAALAKNTASKIESMGCKTLALVQRSKLGYSRQRMVNG